MLRIKAWKALLSEALRNPGQSPGSQVAEQLSGRQYLASVHDSTLQYFCLERGTAFQAAVLAPFTEDFVPGYATLRLVQPLFAHCLLSAVLINFIVQAGRCPTIGYDSTKLRSDGKKPGDSALDILTEGR